MPVRLATYNVHRCIGRDGRRDPGRVMEVLRELDADVVALQELQWEAEAALHLLDQFAHRLDYKPIAGPTLLHEQGHYGNALLTRLPAQSVHLLDLTVDSHEPRGAIEMVVETPDSTVRLVATHLGLRPRERRTQLRKLLGRLDQGPPQPTILMGDINEWFIWGRPLRWLHAWFGEPPAPATFPAGVPLFALDRIWVRPRERLLRIAVHASDVARQASDHLPLLADIAA